MKTLTAILFATMLAFSGTAFAERDVEGEFPWPDTYNADNESVNCEDRCFFNPVTGFYPASDPSDTSNDIVNAEK